MNQAELPLCLFLTDDFLLTVVLSGERHYNNSSTVMRDSRWVSVLLIWYKQQQTFHYCHHVSSHWLMREISHFNIRTRWDIFKQFLPSELIFNDRTELCLSECYYNIKHILASLFIQSGSCSGEHKWLYSYFLHMMSLVSVKFSFHFGLNGDLLYSVCLKYIFIFDLFNSVFCSFVHTNEIIREQNICNVQFV